MVSPTPQRHQGACWVSLLLAVLLLVSNLVLSSAGGFWSQGQYYTDADVLRFTPIFLFHPEDVWMPINLEDLVGNSVICDAKTKPPQCPWASFEVIGSHPYVDGDDKTYYLNNDPRYLFGSNRSNPWPSADYDTMVDCTNWATNPVKRRGGTLTSEYLSLLYVVQNITDSPEGNIVINFFMIQAMAGPESLGIGTVLYAETLLTGNTVADHAGDLQWVQVIIDPHMSQVQFVGTTGHGNKNYFPTAFVGTRPIIYSSLNTHSLLGSASPTGSGDMSRYRVSYDDRALGYFSFYPWADEPYLDYHQTGGVGSSYEITQGNPLCIEKSTGQPVDVSHCPYSCSDPTDESTCVQTANNDNYMIPLHVRIADIIGAGGPIWAPEVDHLVQTGLDSNGEPVVAGQDWVKYRGRYGYSSVISNGSKNYCEDLYCRYGDSNDPYCPDYLTLLDLRYTWQVSCLGLIFTDLLCNDRPGRTVRSGRSSPKTGRQP